MWTEIAQQISQATNQEFTINHRRPVGGGCINQGYAVTDDSNRTYFVKLNQAARVSMFAAEALGLQQMLETATICVPQPITWGVSADSAFIVLEWLELGSRGDTSAWQQMGRQLAAMHSHSSSQAFGWEQNNTIGSTPQINTWKTDWVEFYTQHRLGYQFQLARRQGGNFPQQEQLLSAIPQLLADHQPQPSLVHGDLWGGNAAFTTTGKPVIIDPATYFGDREVDLAMTELFGGFPAAFYQGYNELSPLDPGYKRRKTLYNLYHILNHFNIFGGSYESQANRMIQQILA